MGSRYMLYWRVYIYTNNLYSLPDKYSPSVRSWTPLTFRRQPDELHRLLNFANRDLSVLTCSNQTEVLKIFDILLELLLEVNMKSEEFSGTLSVYLGQRTNQFVHELINFARSPYNDLISYECNVKYRARQPETMVGVEETPEPLLEGLHCFRDFTLRVDEDECVDFLVDLELEDDDDDMIDEPSNLMELSAPLILELRRMNELQAAQTIQQMQFIQQQQQQQQQRSQSFQSTPPSAAAAARNASVASTSGAAIGMPAGVLSSDVGLDVAIERSILEGIASGYNTTPRRNTSLPRQIRNRNRDAMFAARVAVAAATSRGRGGAAASGGGAAAGGGAASGGGAAGGGEAVAAVGGAGAAAGGEGNASIRAAITPRSRSANVAVKRRRTFIREI